MFAPHGGMLNPGVEPSSLSMRSLLRPWDGAAKMLLGLSSCRLHLRMRQCLTAWGSRDRQISASTDASLVQAEAQKFFGDEQDEDLA
jgi:hypothetical protein